MCLEQAVCFHFSVSLNSLLSSPAGYFFTNLQPTQGSLVSGRLAGLPELVTKTPYLSDVVIQRDTIFKIPFINLSRNYIMNEFRL